MANNLIVRGGADFSRFNRALKNAEGKLTKFQRSIASRMNKVERILAAVGASLALGTAIKDAAAFESQMTTLSESLGKSISDFEKWQQTVGRSLGFSKVESAELANILSLNFKMFSKSQQDLLNKTTKMMEVAALVANKRGMAMSEVSDRIRSAMNQEADGADELGVNVRVAAITASNAYKEMANGQAWDELSTNMQKAILYHHVLEQVSTNLGTTIQDTTSMRISVFSAALGDLKLALGQAFTPIVYAILPALTALINKISKALSVIGQFMSVLFGIKGGSGSSGASGGFNASPSTISDQADAVGNLGNAVQKAGKQAKKAAKDSLGLSSFDELSTLNTNTNDDNSSGGGSSGGSEDGASFSGVDFGDFESSTGGMFNKVSQKVKAFANKVRVFIQPLINYLKKGFGGVVTWIKEIFGDIVGFFKENGSQIIQAFKNVWLVLGPIVKFVFESIVLAVKGLIEGIIQFFLGFIAFFTGIFTGDWKMAWEGLKDMVIGALKAVWNYFTLGFYGAIKTGLVKLAVKFGDIFKDIVKVIKGVFNGIGDWFKGVGTGIMNGIKGGLSSIGNWFKQLGNDMVSWVKTAWNGIGNWFSGIGKSMWDGISGAFKGAYDWFKTNIVDKIAGAFKGISTSFSEIISAGLKGAINVAIRAINKSTGRINTVKNHIPGVKGLVGDIPKIPELAQGGYIGKNKPLMAIIGDNKNEGEIVAPESKLYEQAYKAIRDAMGEGGGTTELVINFGSSTIFRKIISGINDEQRRAGKILLDI